MWNNITYFIGNGFDKHHQLKTSYKDYKNFLKSIDSKLVESIDEFLRDRGFPDKDIEEWSKLEEFLEEFSDLDYESMYDDAFNNSEKDMDRASYWSDPQYNANIYSNTAKSIMFGIKKHFKEWIDSIDISRVKKDYSLNIDKNILMKCQIILKYIILNLLVKVELMNIPIYY